MTGRRVAVYGGSFDPPHLGHVLSVAWTLCAGAVDEVWIIPTWEHAFGKQHGAPFDDRMKMCEQAFAPFRNVEISDVERRLGGISRTLYTLQALQAEHPEAGLRLLIGADVLSTTDRWHRWEDVAKIATPLVVGREGYPLPEGCPLSIPNVNSTEIRFRLANSHDLAGLVPTKVIEHIRANGLYVHDE
jgi:nicotinate-nucleotide adenylyltransferase